VVADEEFEVLAKVLQFTDVWFEPNILPLKSSISNRNAQRIGKDTPNAPGQRAHKYDGWRSGQSTCCGKPRRSIRRAPTGFDLYQKEENGGMNLRRLGQPCLHHDLL